MKNELKHFMQVKMLFPFITNDSDSILLCNGYNSLISQDDKASKVCFLTKSLYVNIQLQVLMKILVALCEMIYGHFS